MHPPIPLTVIAGILAIGGAILTLRSLARLAGAIGAKFRRGAPYHRGQIADRLLGLVMTLPLAPAGAALAVLALGQAAFQPVPPGDPVRVAEIESAKAGWGKTVVRLEPDPAYPESRRLEGEIAGARWAIVGTFIDWDPGVRWLGLVPAHRVHGIMGADDVGGAATAGGRVIPIDAMPRMARMLLAWDRYLPMLRVRTGSTPWFPPSDRTIAILYVTPEGYLTDRAALPYR